MADYHQYVFDQEKREFIGEFEEMYKQESISNYDSWHQEDSRQLKLNIVLSLINEMNYSTIIDIGCGKGSFTHKLKKRNNDVYGLDISSTAVEIARQRFPDIQFSNLDVNKILEVISTFKTVESKKGYVDFVFSSECFSYLENWKELIEIISKHTKYFMISLYIPEKPIGFIKAIDELETEIEMHFKIIESIHLTTTNAFIIYAESKISQL